MDSSHVVVSLTNHKVYRQSLNQSQLKVKHATGEKLISELPLASFSKRG